MNKAPLHLAATAALWVLLFEREYDSVISGGN